MSDFELSRRARDDLVEIGVYGAERWGDERSERYVSDLYVGKTGTRLVMKKWLGHGSCGVVTIDFKQLLYLASPGYRDPVLGEPDEGVRH